MTDQEKEVLNMVMSRFRQADDDRKQREEEWREFYKLYRSYIDDDEWNEDGSNLFIPITFANVETVLPRAIEALFEPSPPVSVLPRSKDDVPKARPVEMLLDYQFDRAAVRDRFEETVKDALIYGTGIGKIRWRYEARETTQRRPAITMFGRPLFMREVRIPIVGYDDPEYIPVDIMDFWIDPNATDLDNARYVIHRSWADFDELQRDAERYGYTNLAEVLDTVKSRTESRAHRERLHDVGLAAESQEADEWAREVEILEYWERDRVITVANRSVIIRDVPNPYWHGQVPFIVVRDVKVSHEFYGIGEVEVGRYLQAELNTMRRQRLDNVSLVINGMWKVLRSAEIDPDDLVMRPGGVVRVNSQGDVEPLEMPVISPAAYTEEQTILLDIQRALGTYDYARGQAPARKTTATEIVTLQEVAEIRFRHKIRRFGREGLARIAQQFFALDQQYITSPRVLRVTESEGYNWPVLRPEDVAGEFDFEVAATATEPLATRQVKQQNMLALFNIVKGHPGVDEYEYLKRLHELMDIRDSEKLLNKQVFDMIRAQQLAQFMPQPMMGPGPLPASAGPPSAPPAPVGAGAGLPTGGAQVG